MSTTSATTTGTIGQTTRLQVDRFGTIHGAGAPLGWFIAAEDRWHDPRSDSGVRHTRIAGTPVTETRVRVPGGDVVQRVYTVADGGGITVVEIDNSSTLPVAVAFDRGDLLTERPIPGTPVEGIDLPVGSFVLPVAHKATIRVGLAHHNPAAGTLPSVPISSQVVNGWLAMTARGGRIDVPSPQLVDAVVEARSDIACGAVGDVDADPVAWLLALDQWYRMGLGDPLLLDVVVPDVARAVEMIGPAAGWFTGSALSAAQRLLLSAGEGRAVSDVGRILNGRPADELPLSPAEGWAPLQRLAHVERLLAWQAELLPAGVPAPWLGQSFECHGLPSVAGSTVSFAIRWHGVRPAILWQQDGPSVTLTARRIDPAWSAGDQSGESLWPPIGQ